jgi:hypothetical protein
MVVLYCAAMKVNLVVVAAMELAKATIVEKESKMTKNEPLLPIYKYQALQAAIALVLKFV